jgi:hypothetical protein
MILKGCIRCHGDVFLEEGHDGSEFVCLQCGGRMPVKPVEQLPYLSTPTLVRS